MSQSNHHDTIDGMSSLHPRHSDLSDALRMLMDQAKRTKSGAAPTASALALALGQHRPNLSAKIRGERAWSFDDFFAIAEHYAVPLDTLAKMMDQARQNRDQFQSIAGPGADA